MLELGIYSPIIVFGLVAIAAYFYYENRRIKDLKNFCSDKGFKELTTRTEVIDYLSLSSFSVGEIIYSASGVMHNSLNHFMFSLQHETRGSGRYSEHYYRTVFAIDIPETQIHLIINSKMIIDHFVGGNLAAFQQNQRFELEGDFGKYFVIYMPPGSQAETLSLLTPDVMQYILENLAYFDIEVNGSKLFLYSYTLEKPRQIARIINSLDGLLREIKLRNEDARTKRGTKAIVARIATDPGFKKQKLKALNNRNVLALIALGFASLFLLPTSIFIVVVPMLIIGGLIVGCLYLFRNQLLYYQHRKRYRRRDR